MDNNEIRYDNQKIVDVEISTEIRKAFLDYSMSVIVQRALPDVRDGLKPVHRRILYAMYDNNLYPTNPYRKCATTVGEVLVIITHMVMLLCMMLWLDLLSHFQCVIL